MSLHPAFAADRVAIITGGGLGDKAAAAKPAPAHEEAKK